MKYSIVSEFEGTLLKDQDPFSYFMLVAFEASGFIRFTLLLLTWPVIWFLDVLGVGDVGLKLMVFVATVGLQFYMDDVDMEAWRVFSRYDKRVVVTKMPRIMVERFVKEYLRADVVVGSELVVNRFGFATGFIDSDISSISSKVAKLFVNDEPSLGLGRATSSFQFFSICKMPFIILLSLIRIIIGEMLPLRIMLYLAPLTGCKIVVKGKPPSPISSSNSGVLFVCTHRTLMDPFVLSIVLMRKIPAVTYSLSRLSEILSPIPTVRLTRIKEVDAQKFKQELSKGDLVVFPEGTTCREPFLLRFIPVAMNNKVGFFHATTASGWKALDPIFFFMNPRPFYEVTFLDQLPAKATCSSGKSPHDVANYVQRILAATLGFECTNFTRKDKYIALAGNDKTVSCTSLETW
uniref:Phospholipid/glycerol acyltransferase domain-containing protein n=1 Tax=Gossypium raimondii TaxID=29730 RepID=A0A0D2TE93_GOSRA|nr:hypothetical protein B456_011G267200 [Gossypium raimondii]